MSNISLDNFKLEKYNKYDGDHISTIETLAIDPNITKDFGNLEYMVTCIERRYRENFYDQLFIAYYKDHPIGFISTSLVDDTYDIRNGILTKYRGYHLSSLLLLEFSEYLFKINSNIQELCIEINKENTEEIENALLIGYESIGRNKYILKRLVLSKDDNSIKLKELIQE